MATPLLKYLNIHDNDAFKAWVKINHPDKEGDTTQFQEVASDHTNDRHPFVNSYSTSSLM